MHFPGLSRTQLQGDFQNRLAAILSACGRLSARCSLFLLFLFYAIQYELFELVKHSTGKPASCQSSSPHMYSILLSVVSLLKSYSPESNHPTRESNTKQQTFSSSSSHSTLPDRVMQLQKRIGNQAVLQLMKDKKQDQVLQPKKNETGLPDALKTGLENLSGLDMSDVKVHYQSDKPKQIGALAYAQGTDIHLGPGQEHHLPHEGWHVVQLMQGRVKPTVQMKSDIQINDEVSLEKEADQMGAQALRLGKANPDDPFSPRLPSSFPPAIKPIQGVWASVQGTAAGKLNLKTLTGERSSSGKQLYQLSRTGDLYEEVGYVHGDLVVKPYRSSEWNQ